MSLSFTGGGEKKTVKKEKKKKKKVIKLVYKADNKKTMMDEDY